MLEFKLRDPCILGKLIEESLPGHFSPDEEYHLIWFCQKSGTSHSFDITPSMNTLHLLAMSCPSDDFIKLFAGWKIMNNPKLTFYNKGCTMVFKSEGIIHVCSKNGEEVFHASDSKIFDHIRNLLQ